MNTTRIIFLLLPRVHLLDLAGPVQVFQEAIDYGLSARIEFCALSSETMSSSGLPLGQVLWLDDVVPGSHDYVLVPGAEIDYLLSDAFQNAEHIHHWLRMAYEAGAHVCSICTGAFALGAAGLLHRKQCTTHWKRTRQLQQTYPTARVDDDRLFTEDGRILTSAGVAAGIDLALHLVAKLTDENTSFNVARELVVYLRRSGTERQHSIFLKYRNHIHTGIHRVQDWLHENMHKGATIPTLSEVACMSARNLTRTFKRETGITVNEYVTLVRKEKLKELMKKKGMTRKEMAYLCGLKSERHIGRIESLPAPADF